MYSSLSNTGSVNSPALENSDAFVLANDQTEAVLQFLSKKPIHCAYLTGLLHEHGLVSPLNQGTFYASKNILGELRGVALVGHATIIEPTNQEALKDLAEAASNCNSKHLVMCEERWATATYETCYLGGVWVNPDVSSITYGRACIAELARMLLWRSRSISVLVNDDDTEVQSFYKSGFQVLGSYQTAFLSGGTIG